MRQYFYDANGNVGQLVDVSDGYSAARYEYDPYGNMIVLSGVYAGENTYRFSTKFYDSEVNLYYYGFRHCSAKLGRWLNRDPIEETGGVNLYIFGQNNPVFFFDALGNEYLTTNAPDPYDIDYGGTGSWASPRRPDQMDRPSPVVSYINAGTQLVAGAVLMVLPEGTITKAGGVLLITDGVDNLQALIRGDRTEFEKYLDRFGLSEGEKHAILCLKEFSIITIEVSVAFSKTSAPKSGLEETKVTEKGVSRIERYLNDTPGMSKWGANDEMIARLRAGERTKYDLEFYQHELRESRNYKTMSNVFADTKTILDEAHIKTCNQYGIDWWASHERLIHPDVLKKY